MQHLIMQKMHVLLSATNFSLPFNHCQWLTCLVNFPWSINDLLKVGCLLCLFMYLSFLDKGR